MTTLAGETNYLLPASSAGILTKDRVGALQAVLSWDDSLTAPRSFAMLDCFDQSLRRSGRLLIETGRMIEILMPDGRLLSQPATGEYFLPRLPDGPVTDALSGLSPLRRLQPVANGELRRGELALIDSEGKTRARAILWQLSAHDSEEVLIAMPRGLRGYDKSLRALHRHLEACGASPLQPDALYRHFCPGLTAHTARPVVPLDRDILAFDAANDIIEAHIPVMRANENGIIRDLDTEFLHDYRIALRKIRSVLSLFRGVYAKEQAEELKTRFSALMTPTGALRDLDVYLLEREDFHDMIPDSLHPGLDRMFALFARRRAAEQARLVDWLKSDPYAKEVRSLTRLFRKRRKLLPGPEAGHSAAELACRLIWKRYRRICRIGSAIGPETDDAEVHELRIHCKKLRYLLEFLGPLFPAEPVASLLKPLKKMQDTLGLFNDCSVQQVSLQQFALGLGKTADHRQVEIAQSVGALISTLHLRQMAERAKVAAAFARFNSPATEQSFRALFHQPKDAR